MEVKIVDFVNLYFLTTQKNTTFLLTVQKSHVAKPDIEFSFVAERCFGCRPLCFNPPVTYMIAQKQAVCQRKWRVFYWGGKNVLSHIFIDTVFILSL